MNPVPQASPSDAFAPDTIERAHAALARLEPGARAFWLYDLDALDARAHRFAKALEGLGACVAYALKANALPALLARIEAAGLAAEAGSLGELAAAEAAGFGASRRVLNGNGRTPEEAAWAATHGVHSVNADHVGELDLLESAAARAQARVRVALRVNPGIAAPVHRYIATGSDEAKFGVGPDEALDAWAARARWPHLVLDGVHLHVGSQILDAFPLETMARTAIDLADESASRGAPLRLVNLGGGFGVDYTGQSEGFPLEAWAARLSAAGLPFEWVVEPGRWLVAGTAVLVAEVLWVKERRDAEGHARRFVVLAAGMNDLIRPALYGARHRIEPLRPRAGARTSAIVVGPVCESADVFDAEAELPPLEAGDLVMIRDAGAYGAVMSSNYNGRGRLAEITWSAGTLTRARAGETPADLAARGRSDRLD